VPAAGHLVEPVHVLRHESEFPLLAFELRQREMPRIGLCVLYGAAPPVVPLPDEPGIVPEGLGRREILRPKIAPEAVSPPERRHAAFGGDTRPGQHHYRRGILQYIP